MKKLLVRVMAVACVAMAFSSCSQNEGGDLLDHIPANSLMVGVLNSEALASSADIELTDKGIGRLPDYIADELPSQAFRGIDEVNDALERYGAETSSVAFFVYDTKSSPVAVYKIKDADKFEDAISNDEYYRDMERDGITVYTRTNNYSWGSWIYCIAVKGKYVYQMTDGKYVEDSEKNDDTVQRDFIRMIGLVDSEGSFAGTPSGKYIAEGNVGGWAMVFTREVGRNVNGGFSYAMVNNLVGASLNMRASISGNEIKLNGQLLDKDGSRLNLPKTLWGTDFNGKINGEAVKYLPASTIAAAAVSYDDVDWKSVMNKVVNTMGLPSSAANELSIYISYLDNIGTITAGVGLKDGLKSIFRMANGNSSNIADDIDISVVVEVTSGDARKLLGQITSFLNAQGISFSNERHGISVNMGTSMNPVICYVTAYDKMLVISTAQYGGAQDNKMTSAIDFDRYNMAGAVVLDRDSKLMRQLGTDCGAQLTYNGSSTDGECEFTLKITDSKYDTVVKSVINAIINVKNNSSKIEQLYEETVPQRSYYDYGYDSYSDNYDWDDVIVEEAVEVADSLYYY